MRKSAGGSEDRPAPGASRCQWVFCGIRAHVNGRLRSCQGHEQQRAIFDAKFLFRRLPGILSPVDWDDWRLHYPEPARQANREPILDLVLAWEGAASAAIAERWWQLQSKGFSSSGSRTAR